MPVSVDSDNKPRPIQFLLRKALALAGKDSGLLCYGIGEEGDSIPRMQRNFIHHLINVVQSHSNGGAKILLAGPSVAHMEQELKSADLEPLALPTWQRVQGKEGQSGILETLEVNSGAFQSIVVEGSIRFQDQLGLLSRARQALNRDGHLILFGENLDDDSEIRRSDLANLTSLRQLSERLGFAEASCEDFSNAAALGLRKLIGFVSENREQLLQQANVEVCDFEAFESELNLMSSEFASGRRCFNVFVFRKLADPPGEYAEAEYGDINSFNPLEVKALFEASFGVDFDLELWQWKYQRGKGTCVVARERPGGAIVSHYGGAPRKIDYFGQPSMAIQPCDVMVLPQVRRHYGKSSLFFKTAATFLEREIGNTVGHLLGFGFPNQKAMNIAKRLGLYEKTDDFVEVVYSPAQQSTSKLQLAPLEIQNPLHQTEVDRLWQQMREGFKSGIIGVRDAEYIRYRYFDHPFAQRGLYQCHLLRKEADGEVLAMVALKEHDGQVLLMDVVCSTDVIDAVLEQLNCAVSSRPESNTLKVWISKGWLGKVRLEDCTVNELGIEIPCNSWNPGPSSTTLYGAWWLLAGDMDFM